jgi:hypothetical protein
MGPQAKYRSGCKMDLEFCGKREYKINFKIFSSVPLPE